MHRNVLPFDFPSKLVMSNALGILLGSITSEDLPSPGIVRIPSRMTQRHSRMTSFGACCPSAFKLTKFHVPFSLLASLSAASSAKVGDERAVRTTPIRQTDLRVIMGESPRES